MSDYLCQQLIDEIFQRLPVKSLLRFRSLSKSWYSRIASPHFIRMHTLRSPQKIFVRKYGYNATTDHIYAILSEDQLLCPKLDQHGIILAQEFPVGLFHIVGSCNGIICLFGFKKCCISLWNPSIRCKHTLPDYPFINRPNGLAFGFGFDATTGHHKMLLICYTRESIMNSFLLNLKTNTWCEIASPTLSNVIIQKRSYFLNGALHFVVKGYLNESKSDRRIGRCNIMTFNFSTHVFSLIALPQPPTGNVLFPIALPTIGLPQPPILQLTIIQGSLHLMYTLNTDYFIWVMNDHNKLEYSPQMVLKLNTCLHEEEEEEEEARKILKLTTNGYLLVSKSGEGLRVYNLGSEEWKRLAGLSAFDLYDDMEIYIESLELLERGFACKDRKATVYTT